MKRGKQSARFVAINMLFLLLAVLHIGGSLALALVEKYPSADALVYETCTFARYERISWENTEPVITSTLRSTVSRWRSTASPSAGSTARPWRL